MTRLHASLIAALLLGGCQKDAPAEEARDEAKQAPPSADAPAEPKLGPDGKPLGRVVASEFIDLREIANKTPEQVDALLDAPTDTGSDRISCVRFVPDRVFFACEQQIRVYGHRHFESVRVEFEDGRAAIIALSGLPGDGPFDPKAALKAVGLELPGEPVHDNPGFVAAQEGDVVDRWEWGNDRARLLIDGLEQRVRLTVVNQEWRRAKLELINNNPLSPEQKQRIKPVRGEEPAPAEE
ncbi:MAG: hypothetical protein R6X02_09970 [Enhygromyxa sp.]